MCSGKKILNIDIVSGRYLKNKIKNYDEFKQLFPIKVVGIGVHGKFIYWILENGFSIWSTLGLSGAWQNMETKHTRIKVTLDDGVAYYNDARNFGTLKLIKDKNLLLEKLVSLGPDMLAEDISDKEFMQRIDLVKHKTICEAIMDQSIIAGVGNYVKAESLYLAKISPWRVISSLTPTEVSILNKAIKIVLRKSFSSGGATISSYEDFYGKKGEYTGQFCVYNCKVDPQGNNVKKEKTKDNRTTHWVPTVQK